MENKAIAQLNEFLRGELSAIETYAQALARAELPAVHDELMTVRKSHAERAELLRARIVALGGTPTGDSGVWGTVAKAIEAGAVALGEHLAIAALEEGEDRRLASYRGDLSALDDESLRLVRDEILPAQVRTHDAMSTMKMAMH